MILRQHREAQERLRSPLPVSSHCVCSSHLGACKAPRAAGSRSDKARARTRERSPWRGDWRRSPQAPAQLPALPLLRASCSGAALPLLPGQGNEDPARAEKHFLGGKISGGHGVTTRGLEQCPTFTLAKSSGLEREKSIELRGLLRVYRSSPRHSTLRVHRMGTGSRASPAPQVPRGVPAGCWGLLDGCCCLDRPTPGAPTAPARVCLSQV